MLNEQTGTSISKPSSHRYLCMKELTFLKVLMGPTGQVPGQRRASCSAPPKTPQCSTSGMTMRWRSPTQDPSLLRLGQKSRASGQGQPSPLWKVDPQCIPRTGFTPYSQQAARPSDLNIPREAQHSRATWPNPQPNTIPDRSQTRRIQRWAVHSHG